MSDGFRLKVCIGNANIVVGRQYQKKELLLCMPES